MEWPPKTRGGQRMLCKKRLFSVVGKCILGVVPCFLTAGHLIAPGMWLNRTLGSEPPNTFRSDHEEEISKLPWVEVGPQRKLQVLELLAGQTRGNYEKLRTWQGVYQGHKINRLSREFAASFGNNIEPADIAELVQECDFELQFAIDVASGSIYRWNQRRDRPLKKRSTGEPVTIQNVRSGFNERSVVTAEHYLRFRPEEVWSGFTVVADHPEAQQKRAAFRDPREKAARQEFGALMNPCDFFGFDPLTKFWEALGLYIRALRGETTEEERHLVEQMLIVDEARGEKGLWYRLRHKTTNYYWTSVWSPAAGFNPIRQIVSKDEEAKQVIKNLSWRWQLVDGIFVPVMHSHLTMESDGKVIYQRNVELVDSTLNAPLDEHQFDYQGLGLKDGELVMDRIDEVCYIIRDGEPVKLASFGEAYVPPGEAELRPSSMRWLFLGGNIALIVVILALIWRRRARSARA